MSSIIHKGRATPICILLMYLSLKIIVTDCQPFGSVNSFKCSVKENALTLSSHESKDVTHVPSIKICVPI